MKLTEFEQSLVALGINVATAFSLPKSVGAIFGLIFANARPMALDDCVERLEISKGSASQGLKFLQRMGAIKAVYRGRGMGEEGPVLERKGSSALLSGPVSRKTYYEPEVSLRRLLIGVLNESVMPQLKQCSERVSDLKGELANGPVLLEDELKILKERLTAIETWEKKGRLLMPIVEKVLSKPLKR